MNAVVMNAWNRTPLADAALTNAARFWFAVALVGQWFFVLYIAVFYGGSAAHGDIEAWNRLLPHGYVPGNTIGNTALVAHLLFAATITLAGTLQLMPAIRARFPAFHRWNGRVFVLGAFVMGMSGLYLTLSGRKVVGDAVQHAALWINALLMMACAAVAWFHALARDFAAHRRWALRLFLLVNGTWFFRVGLMAWLMINHGPVGFDMKSFSGPFLVFLAFAQYLLPLAVLELYLRSKASGDAAAKLATAAVIFAFTIVMGLGEFAAIMGMWLPHL